MSTSCNLHRTDIFDVCVVGAGLSGAYAAHKLIANGNTVAVLDARHRIGGRLLTAEEQGGGDLGGAWIWPRSEYVMQQFLMELDVKTVPMGAMNGQMAALTPGGKRHVLPDGEAARYAACGGGAVRVSGGAASMVQKLLRDNDTNNLSIQTGMQVHRIERDGDLVKINCLRTAADSNKKDETTITCRAAVLAAPPKLLANTIEFHPSLPKSKMDCMLATPTWMEDYGKVSVSFPQFWWRRLNMSAISIDQVGAVSTWWEACSGIDGDGKLPTLAGFVTAYGAKTLSKMKNSEAMHEYIIDSLMKIYGIDESKMGMRRDLTDIKINGTADKDGLVISKAGVTVTYKSWSEDVHTHFSNDNGHSGQCSYGDRELHQSAGPIFFAGTETAFGSGHMEGAIIAAQRAADEVIQYLEEEQH
ncbi:hypothetical protein ACHAXR_004932 [Thalassiosira sp. AJA248-18]